ncbi:MAG TPA: hypothetical protein VEJ40_00280 [Pseudolabrys sp.]|nr:hypothetical protein [Pseudolabrys sp.]
MHHEKIRGFLPMLFPESRPDVVRAINQRWLLNFWTRHVGMQRVPMWQAVEAENLTRMADNLSFLEVVPGGDNMRFIIRFHGATIARVYNSGDVRGRFLDEIVKTANCPTGLKPYYRAVETGRPVYTIHNFKDSGARLVHSERLLLPFSRDGETVDRLVAAFEFICPDGAFDNHALLMIRTGPPELQLSATINAQPVA